MFMLLLWQSSKSFTNVNLFSSNLCINWSPAFCIIQMYTVIWLVASIPSTVCTVHRIKTRMVFIIAWFYFSHHLHLLNDRPHPIVVVIQIIKLSSGLPLVPMLSHWVVSFPAFPHSHVLDFSVDPHHYPLHGLYY